MKVKVLSGTGDSGVISIICILRSSRSLDVGNDKVKRQDKDAILGFAS